MFEDKQGQTCLGDNHGLFHRYHWEVIADTKGHEVHYLQDYPLKGKQAWKKDNLATISLDKLWHIQLLVLGLSLKRL